MADEPFEDGFRLQMEKGLWVRLDRAPAVRLVGQIVDASLRVVLRPSDCLEPFPAIRIGTDKSALEPIAVVLLDHLIINEKESEGLWWSTTIHVISDSARRRS